MEKVKVCNKCCLSKSLENDFFKHSGHKDGFRGECKSCFSIKYPQIKIKNNKKRVKKTRKQINSEQYNRIKSNPSLYLIKIYRSRTYLALKKGFYKSNKTINFLGCSPTFLKTYIESQFKDGMSWGNYGQWHIDHIKPCASFDLSKPEEQRKCFHYTNLQPLWAKDNLSKGDKV